VYDLMTFFRLRFLLSFLFFLFSLPIWSGRNKELIHDRWSERRDGESFLSHKWVSDPLYLSPATTISRQNENNEMHIICICIFLRRTHSSTHPPSYTVFLHMNNNSTINRENVTRQTHTTPHSTRPDRPPPIRNNICLLYFLPFLLSCFLSISFFHDLSLHLNSTRICTHTYDSPFS